MKDRKSNAHLCFVTISRYVFLVTRQWQCQRNTNYSHTLTPNGAKYVNLSRQEKEHNVKELKGSLCSQENMFTKVTANNYAIVKARFVVEESPGSQGVFIEGAVLKQCMLTMSM